MNALSNHVLAVLFSWMRTLIQGAWGGLSAGTSAGFWPWIGDHWLLLIVLLCLICTVLDYLVWLIRWRPYVLWRQKLRRLFHRGAADTPENARDFRQGYSDGVSLDLQNMPVPAASALEDWDAPAYAPATPPETVFQEPTPLGRFHNGESVSVEEQAPLSENTPRTRHRRSDRHENRWKGLTARFSQDEDENTPPEDPSAVTDQESMFHKPVYPLRSPYVSWQRNNDQNGNG